METNEEERSWGGWYILSALVVGVVAGMLLAPKSGSETRSDIDRWFKRNRKKTQSLVSLIGGILPLRPKTEDNLGAMKNGTRHAFDRVKEKAKEFVAS